MAEKTGNGCIISSVLHPKSFIIDGSDSDAILYESYTAGVCHCEYFPVSRSKNKLSFMWMWLKCLHMFLLEFLFILLTFIFLDKTHWEDDLAGDISNIIQYFAQSLGFLFSVHSIDCLAHTKMLCCIYILTISFFCSGADWWFWCWKEQLAIPLHPQWI